MKTNIVFLLLVCVLFNACGQSGGGSGGSQGGPPAPSSLIASAQSLTSVSLSWTSVSGASSYKVYRASSASDAYRPLNSVAGTSYTDSPLETNSEYFYRVAAIKDEIEGAKSEAASAKTSLPPVPEGFGAKVEQGNITLFWNKTPGAASYKIYRASNSGGPFSAITSTSVSALSYSDTSVSPNTEYYYRVSSVNGVGESAQSAAVSVSTNTLPAPSGLKTATLSATSIQISWGAVAGAASYNIYMSNSSSGAYSLVGSSTEASFTHNGVSSGTMYFYKVTAVNGIGESPQSDSILGEIKTPSAPTNVVAEALSDSSIKVSWDPVPGALMYKIYLDGGYYAGTNSDSTTEVEYIHSVPANWTYTDWQYRVAAVNTVGQGPWSGYTNRTYVKPIPMTEHDWATNGSNHYFSFPAQGGDYTIQWGDGNGGDSSRFSITAMWQATNSRVKDSTTTVLFKDQYNGYSNPRIISVPDSGYVIIEISSYTYYVGMCAIRYYR